MCDDIVCTNCDQLTASNDIIHVNDDTILCESCYFDLYTTCDSCNDHILQNNSCYSSHTQEVYCEGCYIESHAICDCCNDYCPRDNMLHTHDNQRICEACYESDYFSCESCEEIHHQEDYSGDGYCTNCAAFDLYNYTGELLDYSAKPSAWRFVKQPWENTLYLGVELEIEYNSNDYYTLQRTTEKYLSGKYFYKNDSSIGDGAELVVTPHTLQSIKTIDYYKLLQSLSAHGYRSYEGGNCGLHVHISRNDTYMHNALKYFFINARKQLVKFSQRTAESLDHWCYIPPTHAISWKTSRYNAVNYTGETIELRLFRGTLNYTRFRATLDLCDALVCFLDNRKLQRVKLLQWHHFCGWLNSQAQYSVLKKYLKQKNLLTN